MRSPRPPHGHTPHELLGPIPGVFTSSVLSEPPGVRYNVRKSGPPKARLRTTSGIRITPMTSRMGDDPDAAGADAQHLGGIDFETIRHAGVCRGHITENAIVAETAIRSHVKGADAAVRAHRALLFFLKAPMVQAADGHVQDGFIGRKRQPIGVFAGIVARCSSPCGSA